jgi:uncharacterized phage-associated protein
MTYCRLAEEFAKKGAMSFRYVPLASACDVAAFILRQISPMSTWKLQKLVYYCQAWSLVWDEKPLFEDSIKAWKNGPVVPSLYTRHKGMFLVQDGDIPGNPSTFDANQQDTILTVLRSYGSKSPQWLSDLTHAEDPWRLARMNRGEEESPTISLESISAYYESLVDEDEL